MKVGTLYLCIGCMHALNEAGECTYCGLNQREYSPVPRCLVPGTKLCDRYYIGKVLGEGSFGITYIGWDSVLTFPVAIKEYYPSDLVSRDTIRGGDTDVYIYQKQEAQEYQKQLDCFLAEAKNLSRFNRLKGIVSVRDYFTANNTAYIIMDYVPGINLKKYIKQNGPLPGEKVLELMRPVCENIDIIHRTGLIHRDISPDNLLLDDMGRLVLVDFGAARIRNAEMTKTMTVVFKAGYSPEEQYRSKGKQGAWTDIYSLCATMYYMITGNTPSDSIQRVLDDKVPSLVQMDDVSLSKRKKEAIMKGMAVRAEDRLQTMTELNEVLFSENVQNEVRWRWGKKETMGAVLASALILLLLAVGLWSIREAVSGPKGEIVNADNMPQTVSGQRPSPVPVVTTTAAPTPTPVPTVKMISVKNLTKKQAQEALAALSGVEFQITYKKKYSNSVKKNHIIKQDIAEGTELPPGKSVKLILTISKGKKPKPAATPIPTPIPTSEPVQQAPKPAGGGSGGGSEPSFDGVIR